MVQVFPKKAGADITVWVTAITDFGPVLGI